MWKRHQSQVINRVRGGGIEERGSVCGGGG